MLGERYEARPEQAAMAGVVRRLLEEGGIALVEAGTGTGKSLAYLIPLFEALDRESEERAVVSTHTLHLQEQLLRRDLPLAQAASGLELPAALARGWGNYLCQARLDRALHRPDTLLDTDARELRAWIEELAAWAAQAEGGTRSELAHEVPEEAWQAAAAHPDLCTRQRCPFYESCFYFQARRQVQRARLVVVNHHLLLADRVLRRSTPGGEVAVLPDFHALVVDEAHHLEEVATTHLGVVLAADRTIARLTRLARPSNPLAAPAQEAVRAVEELFRSLARLVGAQGRAGEEGGRLLRLDREAEAIGPALLGRLEEAVDALQALAHAAASRVGAVGQELAEGDREGAEAEFLACSRWAERTAADLDLLVRAEGSDHAFWVETAGPGRLVLRAAPLEVGPVLAGELFRAVRTCLLTSATLTAGGDFQPLRRRLGLPQAPPAAGGEGGGEAASGAGQAGGWIDSDGVASPEYDEDGLLRLRVGHRPPVSCERRGGIWECTIPSPFDFRRSVLVAVPLDLPEPDAPDFPGRVAPWVAQLACAIGGRTFVLFTSHRTLQETVRALERLPGGRELSLLVQGRAPRTRLLDAFRAEGGRWQVLLGTDSFWEGVDVPGPALSLVVLARLPFPVPDHPVVQARAERLQASGLNPFLADALPRAVLKFRQGFGRLVRTAQDRGAVAVLDRRLLARPYGRLFLRALPPCQAVAGRADRVAREVEAWIGAFR